MMNIWSFTDEIPSMIERYCELHPEFASMYEINTNIIPNDEVAYQFALDEALTEGMYDVPDLYTVEATYALKYTKGEMSEYALPYQELGVDVEAQMEKGKVTPYIAEIGTNEQGVVGLGFQSTGGAFIYRRSIARDIWGTDDPADIKQKIGDSWASFLQACEEVKHKGYRMLSGADDAWRAIRNSGDSPWVVEDKLVISQARMNFFEIHKTLVENDYTNGTNVWTSEWFQDMTDQGPNKVLGYLGPSWFIQFVLAPNSGGTCVGQGTFGDWAVTEAPTPFFIGGTWILVNPYGNPEVREGLAKLIEWLTLDTSDTGMQYMLATSQLFLDKPTKDTVGLGAVMERLQGEEAFLGGQNMFQVFQPAGEQSDGSIISVYDEDLNRLFYQESTSYVLGEKTKEEAVRDFVRQVQEMYGFEYDG